MSALLQDLHYAFRQLRRAPAFAGIAILTLALTIGVATAVFSVLDATVIRPLPFHEPDSIVALRPYSPQGYEQPASYPQYRDWRRENTTLSELAGYNRSTANLEGPQGPSPVRVVSGTDNFFRIFDVSPLLGRTFTTGEDQPGHTKVAVLSCELWQQNFAASKDVLGKTIKLDGSVYSIIGVMPAGFRFPLSALNAVYRPLDPGAALRDLRNTHWLPTIGRLKPGVTAKEVQADFNRVLANVGRAFPDEKNKRLDVLPLSNVVLGNTAAPLRVLMLAVAGILALGCVNIAGLLLVRGVRRERELTLRSAVGAARSRIIRQLLTESAVLAVAGAIGGVAVAAGLLQIMRQLLAHSLARGADVHLNLAVLSVALVTSLTAGIAAGVLPAFHFSRVSPAQALRSGGSAGTSRGQNHVRSGLITLQVAIALGLMVCSGLLLRNLRSLQSRDLGFKTDSFLSEEIDLSPVYYHGRDFLTAFYQPLLERLRAIPGVTAAGIINMVPIESSGMNSDVQIAGHPPPPANEQQLAEIRLVTPGTDSVFATKLLRGRTLSDSLDTSGSQLVVTVNQAFVDKFFRPGEDPISKQIQLEHTLTIVGVPSNIRQDMMQPPMPEIDFPASQVEKDLKGNLVGMNLVLRTSVPPETVEPSLRQAMAQIDPTVPFRPAETMQDILANSLTFERLQSWLFGIFAALALLLSLVGIYGMVHHEVELRTRDIGLRMALGSTRASVVGQIVRRVATLMVAGTAAGWIMVLAMESVIGSVIILDVSQNLALLACISATLMIVGVAAGVLPARRAAAIEPLTALRTE